MNIMLEQPPRGKIQCLLAGKNKHNFSIIFNILKYILFLCFYKYFVIAFRFTKIT